MRKLAVLLVVVAAIGGAAWWSTRPEPVLVDLVTVERGTVVASVANTRAGTVDACRRAGLSPALGGQIANLPVVDGSRVAQGDLLLELWNDDLKAQLVTARTEALAAEARAREACITSEVARTEAARTEILLRDRLIAQEDAERVTGRAESSAAACTAMQASAEVSRTQIAVLEAQLERTQLFAPFPGVVAEINGEVGEFVTPSPVGVPTPPTVDLIDSSCLYISAPIDEIDAPLIRPGMPALIHLDAFSDRSFPGHVRRVAPYVLDLEKQARTVEIEAEFDDPEEGLLPGYSADVEVILELRDNVLRIPTTVLRDGTHVFVFDSATSVVSEREIVTGISNWEFTEVLSGLSEGDSVVSTVDREGVEDGAVVEPE